MPPPLVTARLTLLPWSLATEAHHAGLVGAWDDPEVWRYVGSGRASFARADLDRALAWAPEQSLLDDELLVVRNEDGVVLGTAGLYPSWLDGGEMGQTDLGYRLGRACWGQGYGAEAAGAVVRWAAEERGLTRLGANVQLPNTASHRILLRLGFSPTKRRPVPSDSNRAAQWYEWRSAQPNPML